MKTPHSSFSFYQSIQIKPSDSQSSHNKPKRRQQIPPKNMSSSTLSSSTGQTNHRKNNKTFKNKCHFRFTSIFLDFIC
jgi:hypothetical protein